MRKTVKNSMLKIMTALTISSASFACLAPKQADAVCFRWFLNLIFGGGGRVFWTPLHVESSSGGYTSHAGGGVTGLTRSPNGEPIVRFTSGGGGGSPRVSISTTGGGGNGPQVVSIPFVGGGSQNNPQQSPVATKGNGSGVNHSDLNFPLGGNTKIPS